MKKKAYYLLHSFCVEHTLFLNPEVLYQVKNTLTGAKYTYYEQTRGYIPLLQEVRMCIYMLDVTIEDMCSILMDLHKAYTA